MGSEVHNDIICGDNQGNIGIITFRKYQKLQSHAHDGKMINRIIATNDLADVNPLYSLWFIVYHISKKLLMITSGEDETICIWDSSFNPIKRCWIRETGKYIG